MSDEFPLCKEAGLKVEIEQIVAGVSGGEYDFETTEFIRAADVEAYLSKIKCMCEYKEKYFPKSCPRCLPDEYGHMPSCPNKPRPLPAKEPAVSDEFFKRNDFRGSEDLTDTAIANLANRILRERGVVVYGEMPTKTFYWSTELESDDSHTALLINIQPIKQDTAEDIVNALARIGETESVQSLIERARALLEQK